MKLIHSPLTWTAGLVFLGGLASVHAEDLNVNAAKRMGDDLRFLSSDELAGRDTGSEGIARAGEFIAERFRQLGLDTELFDGSSFQDFTISLPYAFRLGAAEKNRLEFAGDLPTDVAATPELGKNFTALSLGSNGSFDGELVFAGYGITALEYDYDDYADVDVAGKVVIVIRKEPQQVQADSKFDGVRSSPYAYFSYKEGNAAVHQAAGLIIVNDSQSAGGTQGDYLLDVAGGGKAQTNNQIPTFFASRSVIDPLLKHTLGKSLDELEAAIDAELKPRSQVLTGITARGETLTENEDIPVRNVVGLLPGAGELKDEYIVVGAHYDHVGMGGPGSLSPGTVAIHNGADDNGSGTTALLEVARRMVADTSENRRSIVFLAFTAEEKGLLGSEHYVRNPRFPLEDTVAMLNMDMVGRLTNNILTVYGLGTSDGFDALVDKHNAKTEFELDKQAAGIGPSDHASFFTAGIPVFHFFTGLHNNYHRPTDDFETVNLEGMTRIATMVTDMLSELSTQSLRPNFIESSARADIGRTMQADAPPRAVMGVQIDQSAAEVRIAEMLPDSPAASAGMQKGDVIVKIGEVEIASFPGLQEVMRGKNPGEVIQLTVRRGDETVELVLTLGEG